MGKSDRFLPFVAIRLIGLANGMNVMGEAKGGISITFSSEQISGTIN